jgi:hypothetical protein
MPLRLILFLYLLLAPFVARAAPPEVNSRLPVLETVGVSEYHNPPHGRGLRLTFTMLRPDPALARFTLEEAREVVAVLEDAFKDGKPKQGPRRLAKSPWGGVTTGTSVLPATNVQPSDMEQRMREQYETLYGAPPLPLPSTLESTRWFQALLLSPRYMDEGVREAAVEMFSAPAVMLSVAMSMMLYMTAWAAPEPIFSKAFAAAVTIGLLMTYTAAELYNVGLACLNLYRDAEAARSREELEAAAERFGKVIGRVGLRVLITVAGARVAKGLPQVPQGGLWARLSPPRFAFAGGGTRGGLTIGPGARAQVSVADGTVVLMGVSANTTAAAVSASVASARTTGACREASNKGDAQDHHIATNKNDKSELQGGPWTPRFEELFARAGMSLEDPANRLYLINHQGPHPEAYHREVYRRLEDALGTCQTQADCRNRLVEELDRLGADICKPGSRLNTLATKKP